MWWEDETLTCHTDTFFIQNFTNKKWILYTDKPFSLENNSNRDQDVVESDRPEDFFHLSNLILVKPQRSVQDSSCMVFPNVTKPQNYLPHH